MKKSALLALTLPMLFVTACGTHTGATSDVPANAQKVQVVASNWQWKLSTSQFQAGKPIDFVVQSSQGTHGFSIDGTDISQIVSQNQSPMNVVWTPKTPGTYTIRCDQYCGSGHANMFVQVHVQ